MTKDLLPVATYTSTPTLQTGCCPLRLLVLFVFVFVRIQTQLLTLSLAQWWRMANAWVYGSCWLPLCLVTIYIWAHSLCSGKGTNVNNNIWCQYMYYIFLLPERAESRRRDVAIGLNTTKSFNFFFFFCCNRSCLFVLLRWPKHRSKVSDHSQRDHAVADSAMTLIAERIPPLRILRSPFTASLGLYTPTHTHTLVINISFLKFFKIFYTYIHTHI